MKYFYPTKGQFEHLYKEEDPYHTKECDCFFDYSNHSDAVKKVFAQIEERFDRHHINDYRTPYELFPEFEEALFLLNHPDVVRAEIDYIKNNPIYSKIYNSELVKNISENIEKIINLNTTDLKYGFETVNANTIEPNTRSLLGLYDKKHPRDFFSEADKEYYEWIPVFNNGTDGFAFIYQYVDFDSDSYDACINKCFLTTKPFRQLTEQELLCLKIVLCEKYPKLFSLILQPDIDKEYVWIGKGLLKRRTVYISVDPFVDKYREPKREAPPEAPKQPLVDIY